MLKFFSSNATNKVDQKGRVSIPASFRKVLAAEAEPTLYLMPEMMGKPAIVGFGGAHFQALAQELTTMNPFDPVHEALTDAVAGEARELPLDETGRIVLPKDLREMAGIEGDAFFIGRVSTFQIWRPETYAELKPELRRTARENATRLPWGGARGAE